MNSYVLNKHQNAEVAQSVEQGTENPRVSGSIPFLGICIYFRGSVTPSTGISLMEPPLLARRAG